MIHCLSGNILHNVTKTMTIHMKKQLLLGIPAFQAFQSLTVDKDNNFISDASKPPLRLDLPARAFAICVNLYSFYLAPTSIHNISKDMEKEQSMTQIIILGSINVQMRQ